MRRWSQAHIERHFTGTDTVRDIVIGMADGLTVPFALPEAEAAEVAEVLTTYGMTADETTPVVAAMRQRPGA